VDIVRTHYDLAPVAVSLGRVNFLTDAIYAKDHECIVLVGRRTCTIHYIYLYADLYMKDVACSTSCLLGVE